MHGRLLAGCISAYLPYPNMQGPCPSSDKGKRKGKDMHAIPILFPARFQTVQSSGLESAVRDDLIRFDSIQFTLHGWVRVMVHLGTYFR